MRFQFSRLDALLVLMTVIWGSNFSVIKSALREIPPLGFNGLRLLIASALFLMVIRGREPFLQMVGRGAMGKKGSRPQDPPHSRRDWAGIFLLAVVGQFTYQLLFMAGLARTSVANSSLILSCTPIFVALMTAVLGQERITPWQWAGTALSALGMYLVVGRGASVSRASITGDVMMLGATICWSAATVGARPLLSRQSPLVVTGYSMAIGCLLYLPLALTDLRDLAWREVSAAAWLSLGFSAVFALCVAYMIWYTAVQRLGNTRTSVYSNVVPIAAMAVAWLWLGEPMGVMKIVGAAAIILGVALTKLQAGGAPVIEPV